MGAADAVMVLGLAGIMFVVALLFGVRRAVLTVIIIRPSCDRAFEWVKTGLHQTMGPLAAVNLLVIGLALIGLVCARRGVLSSPVLAWGGFLLAALASLIHGPDPSSGTRLLAELVTYAAVFSLPFAIVRHRDTAAQCLWVALLSSLAPTLGGVVEFLMAAPDVLLGEGRVESTFTHPNIFAFFIVGVVALILFLTCSSLISLTRMRRWMLYALTVLLLILLLSTKTRSAWLGMLIVLIGYALFVDRRWLVFAVALPTALVIPGIAERINDLYTGNIDTGYAALNSLAWRELLWHDTLEWMTENPSVLLGHGLGLYSSYVPLFFSTLGADRITEDAHNIYLQIYFEIGVVGLIAYFAVFIAALAQLRRGYTRDRNGSIVIGLLLISYLIVGWSDNLIYYLQFQWFFWFILGTVLAWIRSLPSTLVSGRGGHRGGHYEVANSPPLQNI